MRRMGWLLGWAVPEAWFAPLAHAAFPDTRHDFVTASSGAFAELEAAGPFDDIVGYSLGSLLLRREAARAERLGRVTLLAPIFVFPREKNAGGRIALAQIRQLARWLRRDPAAALGDFYQRAGLDVALTESPSAERLATLAWGLECLEREEVAATLPAGWRAWCGADDALLDAQRLHALAPEIVVVSGGGHHPVALLRAMAEGAS